MSKLRYKLLHVCGTHGRHVSSYDIEYCILSQYLGFTECVTRDNGKTQYLSLFIT